MNTSILWASTCPLTVSTRHAGLCWKPALEGTPYVISRIVKALELSQTLFQVLYEALQTFGSGITEVRYLSGSRASLGTKYGQKERIRHSAT